MNEKLPADSPVSEPPPPSQDSSFKRFQRRPKGERAQSGRVLPPPPSWMVKPLKPPGGRTF